MIGLRCPSVLVVMTLVAACGGDRKKGGDTGDPPAEGVRATINPQGQLCTDATTCFDRHASLPEQVPAGDTIYDPKCAYQAQNVQIPDGCECPIANQDTLCGPGCFADEQCRATFPLTVPCANDANLTCTLTANLLGCKHCPAL